jgi:hypothetical protein
MIKQKLAIEVDIMHKIHKFGRPHIRGFLDPPDLLLTFGVVSIEK